jgi:hypothetical protein
MFKSKIYFFYLILFFSACAQKHHFYQLSESVSRPLQIVKDVESRLAGKFDFTATAVFGYRFMRISALAMAQIDEDNQAFTLMGFSPGGMKIADVSFQKGKATGDFLFKNLAPAGVNIAEVIAKDVKRVYFNRLPDSRALVREEKNQVVFCQSHEDGWIEYIFSGTPYHLVRRSFYREKKLIWQVDYGNYQLSQGKFYPGFVALRNHQYQYKIIVKIKEEQ